MSEWRCVHCGAADITAVQPGTDASGRYATGVCPSCCPPEAGPDGLTVPRKRVGVSLSTAVPVEPWRRPTWLDGHASTREQNRRRPGRWI